MVLRDRARVQVGMVVVRFMLRLAAEGVEIPKPTNLPEVRADNGVRTLPAVAVLAVLSEQTVATVMTTPKVVVMVAAEQEAAELGLGWVVMAALRAVAVGVVAEIIMPQTLAGMEAVAKSESTR